jgi:C1A family cysteine protease
MLGWHRDLPDHRDYAPGHAEVKAMLGRLPAAANPPAAVPDSVDWREEYCPPVKDQLGIRSGAAHACLGLVEYFERRSSGKVLDLSRLFLYKTTRRMLHLSGDTGAGIRPTIKALIRFGVPLEEYVPYDLAKYDAEPDPFMYSCVIKFRSLHYVRFDPPETTGAQILHTVKAFLAAGFPCIFGFPVTSLVDRDGNILFPRTADTLCGGQVVAAMGFDDRRRVGSSLPKGALLIRNSWGAGWGEGGYGWLPYEYILGHLAADFWTFFQQEWLDSGEFAPAAL